MKKLSLLVPAALLVLGLSSNASAATAKECSCCAVQTTTVADTSAWLAKAKADYPLTTCVVSGEKLETSSMGDPIDYIHKEAGKPDRLVRFCCSGCVKKFKKDPAKFLALIDAAPAKK